MHLQTLYHFRLQIVSKLQYFHPHSHLYSFFPVLALINECRNPQNLIKLYLLIHQRYSSQCLLDKFVMSFNLNPIIQMYQAEDNRRKTNSTNNLKTAFGTNSHNSLLSALDKKRSDVSKEKVKINHMPEQSDHFDPKGSATINFRTLKNNQNNLPNQKPTKDCYQIKIQKKPMTSQQPSGIQINVNLQNMISNNRKFQLNQAQSDRSLSKKKKEQQKNSKNSKKVSKNMNNLTTLQDFQCDQVLELKPQRKTEKKVQPLLQKNVIAVNSINGTINTEKPVMLLKQKSGQVNDIQKQIKDFENKVNQIDLLNQNQALYFLDFRQLNYQIDPLYIQKKQKNLNWSMRAILMDWMMHISYEFSLKRQTLYIALTLVDNFFQSTTNLSKADFQLSGAAALFIAAKLQQFQPLSSKQFAKSTKQRYSAEQIKAMQHRIAKILKYNLNPPTINMWANKVMQQWDLFLDNTKILKDEFFLTHQPKYFKKIDEQSYMNYRKMMQILDCSILDIQTVQYKPKTLVCSLLYLVLGKEFEQFNKKIIVNEMTRTSLLFLEQNDYNRIFSSFLQNCIGIKMFQLLPSVQYMASYFSLQMTYQRPCVKSDQQSFQNMHLEEYCSYQTYNPKMMEVVRTRFRGIYQ